MRKRAVLTFLTVAVAATVVLNAAGTAPGTPEVVQRVRLAAQAAEVPVPRPLPVDSAVAEPVAAPVAIAPPPAEFTGPPPARVAPPVALAKPAPPVRQLHSGTWAVVIGINDYPGEAADLDYAVNDATDVVQALTAQGAGDHIMFLRDGQVTASVIKSAVAWLTNNAGPDAVAVFFFAGHVRKMAGREAIVTADGSAVRDFELASWLRPLQARQAWITLAACYGGGFTEVLAPGRVLTGAAGPDDIAYENSAFGRSYLVEYMVQRAMLQGAAPDSVQSAFAWAHAKLSQEHPGREPVQYDETDRPLRLRSSGQSSAQPGPGSAQPAPQEPQQPAPSHDQPSPAPQPASEPPPSEPSPEESPPPRRDCRSLLRLC